MVKPTLQQRQRRRRAVLALAPAAVFFALGVWILLQDADLPVDSGNPSSGNSSLATPTQSISPEAPGSAEWQVRATELQPEIDQLGSELYVVNKLRPYQPADYLPEDLVVISDDELIDNSRGQQLTSNAAKALTSMAQAMAEDGLGQLFINSGYRSYETQVDLFAAKIEQYGEAKALIHSAKPGHSEHQSGLAVDVSMVDQSCAILACFGQTEAGKWLAKNSWRFGFIIRYPDGWQPITGYTYEPWHLRFIGVEVAELLQISQRATLEDFWGLPPAPDYPS